MFSNPKMADTYERILNEAQSGNGTREAEIERARKAWSQGFVAEAIDRFCRTQEVMDTSRPPPSRRAHRRRHGEVAGDRRGADLLRLRPLHGAEGRAVDARAW